MKSLIKQKESDFYVNLEGYNGDLEQYPAIVYSSSNFEIVTVADDFEVKNWLNYVSPVPENISRMALKIQLLLRGISISEIIETINLIPDYMFPEQEKQIAIIKLNEASYFDRYNADLQLIATLIGLSQTDLDDIFINGQNI